MTDIYTEIIEACRGTKIDDAGLRALEKLRARLEQAEKNARRYLILRNLFQHERWNDIRPIAYMKPEFEKYVNPADLDKVLDEQAIYVANYITAPHPETET